MFGVLLTQKKKEKPTSETLTHPLAKSMPWKTQHRRTTQHQHKTKKRRGVKRRYSEIWEQIQHTNNTQQHGEQIKQKKRIELANAEEHSKIESRKETWDQCISICSPHTSCNDLPHHYDNTNYMVNFLRYTFIKQHTITSMNIYIYILTQYTSFR